VCGDNGDCRASAGDNAWRAPGNGQGDGYVGFIGIDLINDQIVARVRLRDDDPRAGSGDAVVVAQEEIGDREVMA
jgi:hypothetical protein